ncbi:MAG: methyltransferase domain-containing protein [Chitinivibrionales bacterium]|nr:methyltransferase domain-containing protein [Chitinivibrionales bacterium]
MKLSEATSQFYDKHWADFPLDIKKVADHLIHLFPEGVEGKRVLDAGCGSGIVSLAFSKLGADVLGVDASAECINNSRERAKQFGLGALFERHDLTQLDLGEKRFDIIYSWGVLHHTADARESFDRLVRHLSPKGKIVIAVYLKTWLSGFWNFSRIFYQKSPWRIKKLIQTLLSIFLRIFDMIHIAIYGKENYYERGTQNAELINDWFGVPQRTFHSYNEVFNWFKENDLEYKLTNPATGRFKSTSNFEVVGTAH